MLRQRSFLGSVLASAFIKQFEWVQAPLGRPAQIANTIWADCEKQRPAILVLSRAARAFEDMAVDAGLPEFPRDAVRALANPAVAPTVKRWIAFAKAQFGVAIERAQVSMPERVELNSHAGAIALRLLFQTWHLGQLAEVWYHENHFFDEVVSCTQSDVGVFCLTRSMANDPDAPKVDKKVKEAADKGSSERGSSIEDMLLDALFGSSDRGGEAARVGGFGDLLRERLSQRTRGGNPQTALDDITESLMALKVGPEAAARTRRQVERARAGRSEGSPSSEVSDLAARLGLDDDQFIVAEIKPGEDIGAKLDELFGRRRRGGPSDVKAESRRFSVEPDEEPVSKAAAPWPPLKNPVNMDDNGDFPETGAPPSRASQESAPHTDDVAGPPPNYPPAPTAPPAMPEVTRLSTPDVRVPARLDDEG